MSDRNDTLTLAGNDELAQLREALAQAAARERDLRETVARLQGELAARQMLPSSRVVARLRGVVRRARRAGLLAHPAVPAPAPAGGTDAKQVLRSRAEAEFGAFLRGTDRLALPHARTPVVSILLVLFNQAALTFACLRSIAATSGTAIEVIIVDNASSDQTGALLDRLDGAHVIRNPENRHFLLASNQAAAAARGEALLLLNNDACLRPGALAAATAVLAAQPDVGAVGGMIVLPDGTLQEAGSIIFSDGTCLGYGRGGTPGDPAFRFVRDVDYCSGAFLLVRRGLFDQLGGFDTAFAPAYYEETDFCMRLRAAGHRIVYHPDVAIDHYEFASSTSSEAALALQRRNHLLFADRHRERLLAEHPPPGTDPLFARMRPAVHHTSAQRGRVLVIEDRVPFPAMGAGYPRAAALLAALHRDGWFVTLYPLLFPEASWEQVAATFPREMEVMLGLGEAGLAAFLRARNGYYDTIIVSRPHNMKIFLDQGGAGTGARLIYDAEAVFATREFLRLALAGTPLSPARQQAQLAAEMKLAQSADRVITVSPHEAEHFRRAGCLDVAVLGHALTACPTPADPPQREGLLFVGALDDDPSPNTDSLLWFAGEVMPLLDGLIGAGWQLQVAGRAGAARVRKLAGPRIKILGRVEELTPLYNQARVFVAPTRYAGGIPHKVHEAAARGVPVVATALLAEQLGWSDGQELLVADTPEAFAGACARLFRDDHLWRRLRDRALARLAEDCDEAAFAAGVAAVMAPTGPKRLAVRRTPPPGRARRMLRRVASLGRLAGGAIPFLRANGLAYTKERFAAELRMRTGRRDYATWISLYDRLRATDRQAIAEHVGRFANKPVFSLLLPVAPGTGVAALQATVAALTGQLYPLWQLCVADRAGDPALTAFLRDSAADDRIRLMAPAAGDPLTLVEGLFIIPLAPGDVLRPHALYMLAAGYDADPETVLFYTDEDRIDAGTRADPHFKPDFSPELARDPQAFGGLVALRRDAVLAAGGFSGEQATAYDLALRVAERADPLDIRHLPNVLIHRAPAPCDTAAVRLVVADHLARLGETADVTVSGQGVRVVYPVPDPAPLVSVIVPTRDRAALLRRCVQGLLDETDYPAIEILIVDNASREPQALRLLERLGRDPRVRVLPFPYAFNYAAMNNRAVDAARGEIVLLLNNDIAIREPGWLREMVAQVRRPGVGAVGAKLLYGDGTIQHAGVATGIFTVAGHPFRRMPAAHPGHHGSLYRVQSLSCVTAACMAVPRRIYQEIGGLDEVNLTVSYNDVDFCLRLRERGYRIIFTPYAVLDHLESVSRGDDTDAENIQRAQREEAFMTRKWGAALGHDPFYNPNLTQRAEDYGLAFPPRVAAPWRLKRR